MPAWIAQLDETARTNVHGGCDPAEPVQVEPRPGSG